MGFLDVLNRDVIEELEAYGEQLARAKARVETSPSTAIVFNLDAYRTPKSRYEMARRIERNKNCPAWCRQMHYSHHSSLEEFFDGDA